MKLGPDFTWRWPHTGPGDAETGRDRRRTGRRRADCVADSRHEQLDAVRRAGRAALRQQPRRRRPDVFDLSPANQARIAGVAGAVLLITVAVTVAGRHPAGPAAARADRRGAADGRRATSAARVKVTGRDEIGQLAAAFNDHGRAAASDWRSSARRWSATSRTSCAPR